MHRSSTPAPHSETPREVCTRVNTAAPGSVRERGRKEGGRRRRKRTPDPAARFSAHLFYLEILASASAGGKAGSRECPSDAKAAPSDAKVAAGELESRRRRRCTGPRKFGWVAGGE